MEQERIQTDIENLLLTSLSAAHEAKERERQAKTEDDERRAGAAAVLPPRSAFDLTELLPFFRSGLEVIVQDGFSRCFESSRSQPWNWNFYLWPLWATGVVIRYCILFPIRSDKEEEGNRQARRDSSSTDPSQRASTSHLSRSQFISRCSLLTLPLFLPALSLSRSLSPCSLCVSPSHSLTFLLAGILLVLLALPTVKLLPLSPAVRRSIQRKLIRFLCGIFVFSWTGVIKYHGQIPAKKPNQIYVANHTSMIDIIVLSQMHTFSLVGQKHPGWIGFMQENVLGVIGTVWFQRGEADDRVRSAKKMRAHIQDPANNRLLVFPEGTCSNSWRMQGSEEIQMKQRDTQNTALTHSALFCSALSLASIQARA